MTAPAFATAAIITVLAVPAAASAEPSAAAIDRASARLGGQAIVEVDGASGGLRSLGRSDGLLTGPSRGDPAEIALDYAQAMMNRATAEQLRLMVDFMREANEVKPRHIERLREDDSEA